MTASQKLPQFAVSRKPPINRSGVVTLSGFGIKVWIQAGHLQMEDGVGMDRRKIRLARVNHGLKRLVCIGSDGFVSLPALRWLADQDVAFTMLERSGKVLLVTGPVRSSDAKLRRAQALAHSSGAALRVSRQLIRQKLVAQEQVARLKLLDARTADEIARFRDELPRADCINSIRLIESQAARVYWSAFSALPINFPKNQLSRVPAHWLSFGMRVSPLTGSPRLACNPPNGILNFLYAILECEARSSAACLGLDPGLGVLHVDTTARDSLACDLVEPIRAQVDSYLLDLITRDYLNRHWFIEGGDGNCRLSVEFASRLAQTAPIWGRAVAPVAEWVVQQLWSSTRKRSETELPPTRLTQNRKREAKGRPPQSEIVAAPLRQKLCRNCGHPLSKGGERLCITCAKPGLPEHMRAVAEKGRLTAQSPTAQLSRSATQKKNWSEIREWDASSNPEWLNEQTYKEKILPALANCKTSEIARLLGISLQYAVWIRRGKRQPHPRHWQALAKLASVRTEDSHS